MSTPTPSDINVTVNTLNFRIDTMERDIKSINDRLREYVSTRENDLKIQSIQDSAKRMEADITKVKDQLTELNSKLVSQDQDMQKRDAAQKEQQANLQITTMKAIIGTVVFILGSLLVAYFTHILH